MLLQTSQFILKYGIKNSLYMLNPSVIENDLVQLPKFSIVHYLDNESNNHFPNRDLYYFNNIPKNKRIPIFSLTDLITKDETSVLENKYAEAEVRKWLQNNNKDFKLVNLLEIENTDSNVISVMNYNLLKDLYKYKNSVLTNHFKYHNLYGTYWSNVKNSVTVNKNSVNIVSINIPNVLPSYNIVDLMIKFNYVKFSRVVTDIDLINIIEIYKWLSKDTVENSILKNITDEDTKQIILELKYKGYSTFLPLNILKSLSLDSSLENNTKLKDTKVKKIFLLMLIKIQDKINQILENNETVDVTNDERLDGNQNVNVLQEQDTDDTENIDETDDTDTLDTKIDNANSAINLNKNEIRRLDNINNLVNPDSLNNVLETAIVDFEKDTSETDSIYEETILKVLKETEESTVEQPGFSVDSSEEHITELLKNKTLDSKLTEYLEKATAFKLITSAEIRGLKKLRETRNNLKSPYDENTSFNDSFIINQEELVLNEDNTKLNIDNNLIQDNLKKDIITTFDRNYTSKVMKKDILSCINSLENSGIIIKNYEIEENKNSLGKYEVHKLNIKPIDGKESTIYFRIPVIDSEGEFVSSSIKYRMRKVKTDLPIRKISPTRVALTSNYSKLFIFRTERKTNDPYSYIVSFIRNSYLNDEGEVIKIIPSSKTLNDYKLPNIYNILSSSFNEIKTNKLTLLLNYEERSNYIDSKILEEIEKNNLVFCGYLNNKEIIVINNDNEFLNYSNNESLGYINDILNIEQEKIPKAFSVIKILGDDIPLGIVMSYYLGLNNLIAVTNTKFSLLESNKQYKPNKNELVLKFEDYKLILETDTEHKKLLFNSFVYYKDFIKQYSLNNFNLKEIYLNLIEFRDSGLIHIKEMNMLESLFLDPITKDVLKSINEPTDYLRLLLRANDLLSDLSHPDINDPRYCRIRGYDRVPGLMYRALSESIRDFNIKGRKNVKVELDPYKVWNYITQDNTVKITEDINPILDIKEAETVTLTGLDGLNKDAIPKKLRRYHKNEIGLMSEATVDSADVAINTYLTAYPKIKNVRGLIDNDNKEYKENLAKAFSTSAMLSPMTEYDDQKRVNFVSIQNGHSISTVSYKQPLIRTGYEYLMPYKAGKLYSVIAKEDGTVEQITNNLLTVKFKSGKVESYKIGNQYGRMEGSVYPHSLVTKLSVGAKFKANDYLAYNENFFEVDWLDKSKLVMKFNRNVTVALTMNNEVYEDSSAISKSLSEEMSTYVVKEKIYVIDFKKNIINLLPEGTPVDSTTILFTVLENDGDFNNLSESTIAMLQNLASLSPKAKYKGTIDRYEIKYNGDTSDMSPTFKKLVSKLDKQIYDETKGTEYEASNNKVSSEYRSEGKNLNIDTLELKVFIKVKLNSGIGDKGVFANQMKSVISDIFESDIVSESGIKIDAMFGYKSILNRSVNSPILMGTTNRLLKHVSGKVADIYFNK